MGEVEQLNPEIDAKLAAIEAHLGINLSRANDRAHHTLLNICYQMAAEIAQLKVDVKFLTEVVDGRD